MTITSIDPIKINKEFHDIYIQYSGKTINPETLIINISKDIIEQMNKHLIEIYMDEMYPDIDILDESTIDNTNNQLNNIDHSEIYNKYKYADVYVPIMLTSNIFKDGMTIYLRGTIRTDIKIVDIINDIRLCLDTNDTSENFIYDKDDIVFRYGNEKQIRTFEIITNAQLTELISI
jgi:hypothetical protein